MPGTAKEAGAMLPDQSRHELIVCLQATEFRQAEVDFAGCHLAHHVAPTGDMYRNADFRALGEQARQRRVTRNDARIGTQGHPERTDLEAGQQRDLAQHILFGTEQGLAALDHQFTERGQRHRPPLAVEQGDAQLRLQRLNALGERRLRDIQRYRGPPEMRVADKRQQMLKASLGDHDK